jgi:hypothetical protein
MLQALLPNPASMTDPRASRPLRATTAFPCEQDPIEISCEIQHAGSIGLGVLGLKIQLAFRPVHLPPLQRTDFAHSHAAVIGKARGNLTVIGQRPSESEKVFMFEEA